jgi:uncharacterized membrane protein (UPF0127 family)
MAICIISEPGTRSMRFWRNSSIVFLLLLAACGRAETYPLSIGDDNFSVELADDNAERAKGLMFRETLADDAGMLFLFEDDRPRSFWMKNTLIPLDILFIRSDGTIVHISRNTRPRDESAVPSEFPVRAVLEIPGGQADKRGISVGDKIKTEILK